MSGGKCILYKVHIFSPKYFCTSGVPFYGLEAIRKKFIGQPEERAPV